MKVRVSPLFFCLFVVLSFQTSRCQTFSPTNGAMTTSRFLHTSSVLQDGTVLIAGGANLGLWNLLHLSSGSGLHQPLDVGVRIEAAPIVMVRESGDSGLVGNRVPLFGDARQPASVCGHVRQTELCAGDGFLHRSCDSQPLLQVDVDVPCGLFAEVFFGEVIDFVGDLEVLKTRPKSLEDELGFREGQFPGCRSQGSGRRCKSSR